LQAFRGSSRVSRVVSREAVADREGILSFIKHPGEAAELVSRNI
jgi:hypothetical protein